MAKNKELPQPGPASRRARTVAVLALVVIAAVGTLARIGTRMAHPQTPHPPIATGVSLVGAPLLGRPDAPFALMVLSDLGCDACGQFVRDVLPALEREYVDGGRVQVRFRYFPLDSTSTRGPGPEQVSCFLNHPDFWFRYKGLFSAQSILPLPAARIGEVTLSEPCPAAGAKATLSRLVEDPEIERASALGVTVPPAFMLGAVSEHNSMEVRALLAGHVPLAKFKRTLAVLGIR